MQTRINTSIPLCIDFSIDLDVEVVGFLVSSSIRIAFAVDLDVEVVGFLERSSASQSLEVDVSSYGCSSSTELVVEFDEMLETGSDKIHPNTIA